MSVEGAGVTRLDNVQALRGIAALLVVFYHIALFLREGVFPGIEGFPRGIWDRGWAGVDLFFIISGFIMVWTTQNAGTGPRAAGQFLWRRVTRIYPLWWLCAAVMAVYFFVTYGMPAAPDRVDSMGEAWTFALKSFALWPQTEPPLLGVGWTLIHEMWFYLVFAALLLLRRDWLVWGLVFWAVVTLGIYLSVGHMRVSAPVRFVMLSPLSLEFIVGALAGLLFIRSQPKALSSLLPIAILTLASVWIIIAMGIGLSLRGQTHHFSRMAVFAVPMAALIWGSSYLALRGKLNIPRALVWLGNISYSLYLTHYIVLIVVRRILRSIDVSAVPPTLINIIMVVILLVGSLITAWLTYCYFERPLIKFFKRKRGRSPAQMSG